MADDRLPQGEPGSHWAGLLRDEKLAAEQEFDEDDWNQDDWDYDPRKEMEESDADSIERLREWNDEWMSQEHVHEQRELAEGHEGTTWQQVVNDSYSYLLARRAAGDRRPDAEIKTGYYHGIYPQFGPYVESRLKADPNATVEKVTQDFLGGLDSQTPKSP